MPQFKSTFEWLKRGVGGCTQVEYHMTVQQSSVKKVTRDPRDFWSKLGHEVIKVRVSGNQWVGPRGSAKGRLHLLPRVQSLFRVQQRPLLKITFVVQGLPPMRRTLDGNL